MPAARITITIDEEILDELKARVRPGEVSSYVVEALRAKLQRDPIIELLRMYDEVDGPLTADEIAEGERWWSEMNARLSSTPALSSGSPAETED